MVNFNVFILMNIQQMDEYNDSNIVYIHLKQRTCIDGRVGWSDDNTLDLFPEVLGSILGRDTGCPEVFVLFLCLSR
jgi:hypothetical protein